MEPPQGIVRWVRVKDFISAQMTFAPGISPSTCRIRCPPQDIGKIRSGTLTFEYGGKSWKLRNCQLDSIVATVSDKGETIWELQILDRRWLWRECGQISGFYNARDGGKIRPGTEREPSFLAWLCLTAMGERHWDIRQFHIDTLGARPEVDWEYTNPAQALSDLCGKFGYLVVLGLSDDRVYLCKKGEGKDLPDLNPIAGSELFDPSNPPKALAVAGGRTRYQADFELEAVGLERDGTVVPIDELSYAPPSLFHGGSWSHFDVANFGGLPNPDDRDLAQQTVYRWYRIKEPFHLPGVPDVIDDRNAILPLENQQVERWTLANVVQPRPPWVYGDFYSGGAGQKKKPKLKVPNLHMIGAQHTDFRLDTERGIVQFAEPVYLQVEDPVVPGFPIKPAKLWLRVACNLRGAPAFDWFHEEWSVFGGPGRRRVESTRYIIHEDLVVEWVFTLGRLGGPQSNILEITPLAYKYLDAAVLEYQPKDSASMTYPGLHGIAPDGTILQVTWIIAPNGRATTRVSRNREESHIAPTQKELWVFEQLHKAFREKHKPSRQLADDLHKRKAPL